MKQYSTKMALLLCMTFTLLVASSCDMMHEDRDDCPTGLYITFKYDYNLQRADMFNDHVGAVTLYVFDEQGRLVKTQEESNRGTAQPLKDPMYKMHITDLPDGRYQFIALAGQKSYSDQLTTQRAKFKRTDMATGSNMTDLEIMLDHIANSGVLKDYGEGTTADYMVENNALPLDTLWHGMKTALVEVKNTRPTYDTISLVRDTKRILVTLREIDDPTLMDVNDYEFRIIDKNTHILWDNSLDETDEVVYTPYFTDTVTDADQTKDKDGNDAGYGKTAKAEFMTSRLLAHNSTNDDAKLVIINKETGKPVVDVDLTTMLSRLKVYDDYHYSNQEFLDRGYDYQLHFYLIGGRLKYVDINIDVLSWAVRYQFEELAK